MADIGRLRRRTDDQPLLDHVTWCNSFFCKLLGLMFRRSLNSGEGLLMVENRAGRVNTSIHMLFMAFPIATFWLDNDLMVVDKVLAKPWHLIYIPASAARYTLETFPDLLDMLSIGDQLVFEQ